MNKQLGYTINELVIVIFGFSALCLAIGGVIVVIHFILKFW